MIKFRLAILTILLIGVGFLSFSIYQIETEKRNLKTDLIELSNVKYGLFNVDEWKSELANIISKKIREFNFNDTNKEKIRKEISGYLTEAVDKLEENYYDRRQNTISGFLQSTVASVTGVFGEIRKNIPEFTDQIIAYLDKPQNRESIRKYIIKKLNEYADKTFAEVDYTTHNTIIALNGYSDRQTTIEGLKSQIEELDSQEQPYIILLFSLILMVAAALIFSKSLARMEALLLSLLCGILLSVGLLLPMIDIDARIEKMSFHLLGETITFQDQVLFYKSKSILEVVQLMLTNDDFKLIAVGLLVLLFSVIFPISKLLSSVGYLYSKKFRENWLAKFMVHKSGKWSMADVMVVAIFMAYIGFTGIISEQLKQIDHLSSRIDVLTTNESTLQVGFYLFTAFTVLSLLVSHKIQFGTEKNGPEK